MRRLILIGILIALLALLALPAYAGNPPDEPPGLAQAIAIQEAHTDALLAKPGVVGTGVGLAVDGQPVIRIFTLTSGVADLPNALNGTAVEIVVTGRVTALSHPEDTDRYRPAHTGNSVGHPDITAGTIGAKVTDGVDTYILSNNHVLADVNNASMSDAVIQPGSFDGGSSPADDIGALADFEPISFKKGSTNTIDAAIAQVAASEVTNTTHDGAYTLSSSTARLLWART